MTTYNTPSLIDTLTARIDAQDVLIRELLDRVDRLENPARVGRNDELKGKILEVFHEAPRMKFNRQAVAANLDIEDTSSAEYQRITARLKDLEAEGKIVNLNGDTSRPLYRLA